MSRGQEERSIYGMLRAQIAAGGDLSTFVLPDDEAQPGRVKFAPGAWDGVISHHVSGDEEVAVDALFAAIRGATKGGLFAQRRFTRLVGQATDPHLLGVIDPLLDRARAADDLDGQRLHQLAARLATEPAGRGPVKLGIALLGLFPVDHHREILLTLGRHDEFTLYAAVALSNGQPNPDDDLWTLAREVDGWGRIHLVERLANTKRADILDWILRDGFRNSVMDEYLAYIAASRGDLLAALSADHVDDELLYAAGDLLVALFNGGPAQDINDYADGATVTHIYLNLMRRRAEDLRHLLVVGAIRDFVTDASPEKQWPDGGWTQTAREQFAADCDQLIARADWQVLARQGLESTDSVTFWRAERSCEILGISTLDILLRQLRADPLESGKWFSTVRQADQNTIRSVVDLAVELLPLAEIASGPADEMGLGRQWAPHQCLDFIVQDLRKWPGTGWPLIAASLGSPVVRNRNMAINALAAWPRADWPAVAEQQLQKAIAIEPAEDVRTRMITALDGQPLE